MAILTKLPDVVLDQLVKAYDLGPRRASTGIEAGTVNTSYALDLDAGRFFLRVYEEQGELGARAEAALLVHLASRGVKTPAPVPGKDGAVVRLVAGKPAALFPWVEGDMLCQDAVTAEAAAEVGEALGRLHLAGGPPEASLGEGRFGPKDLVTRCARVASSPDAAAAGLADVLAASVRDVAARRRADLPSGLVHGDLFRDNVLFREGRLAALLDFESAHRAPFAFDLAVTLLAWSFRDTLDVDVARAVVGGYRRARELEESEREGLFEEALLACLRFTITRITDIPLSTEDEGSPAAHARRPKRWQRFVARREAIEQLGRGGLREALGL